MEMIDKNDLYPILFEPIYMGRMWGGSQMASVLHRELPESKEPIGESWELVDRDGEESVIANGALKGLTIRKLIEYYGKDIIANTYHGNRFPLLVKIIDAGKRLSLQVHPDISACRELGNGAEPKTEMWYIISAERNAKIIAGIKPNSTKRQIVETMSLPDVENYLQVFDSIPGDAYFIPSGKIHAIGAGNLILEIQQNSDTTYRVSDWGRVDSNGKSRELHVEQALKSIDFTDRTPSRITGVSDSVTHNRKYPIIRHCPYFLVNDLRLVDEWRDSTFETSSFHLITPINNPVKVGRDHLTTVVPAGCTCFIPASFGAYTVSLEGEGQTTVIRTNL